MTNQESESDQTPPRPNPRVVDAESLLAGEKQVEIAYKGVLYRLLVTRNDKLILQK